MFISEENLAILLSLSKNLHSFDSNENLNNFVHAVFFEILKEKLNLDNKQLESFIMLLRKVSKPSWEVFIDRLKEEYSKFECDEN